MKFLKGLLLSNQNVKCLCLLKRCFSTVDSVEAVKVEGSRRNKSVNFNTDLDIAYYLNPVNRLEIEENIKQRNGRGNLSRVTDLYSQLSNAIVGSDNHSELKYLFLKELSKLPNKLHPGIKSLDNEPKVLNLVGKKREFNFKPKEFSELSKQLRIFRSDNLGQFTGHRSYYFMGQLAEMEDSLVRFSLKNLLSRNFQLISVPDILDEPIYECVGIVPEGERSQVFTFDPDTYNKHLYLSGTSELAIARYLVNRRFVPQELPLRLAAVSRCYRAESSRAHDERGIYRVHHFTKVEMFGVTMPEESDTLMDEFREIEEYLFKQLDLHFQVLDMPPVDIGDQAYRKYDIEAWMPGRGIFGEISSCSSCSDFQSRRLNIKVGDEFVHTINGTACAVPRLVIAILENNQNVDGTVNIPPILQPFMRGETLIKKNSISKMKPFKLQKK